LWDNHSGEAYGFPWIKGDSKKMFITAIKSKVLCKKHNEMLKDIDGTAFNFFKEIFDPQENGKFFNGYTLERWFMKLLFGLVSPGNAQYQNKSLKNWTPDKKWLETLFYGKSIPKFSGLHFVTSKKRYNAQPKSMHFQPTFKISTKEPVAIAVAMEEFIFLYAMEKLPPKNSGSNTTDTIYHSNSINIICKNRSHQINLIW